MVNGVAASLGLAAALTSALPPNRRSTTCLSVNLPAGGHLLLPGQPAVALPPDAAYRPTCALASAPAIALDSAESTSASHEETSPAPSAAASPQLSDFRDPFYASVFPQCYALAATTVVAYTLVVMLFVTPRSFLDGGVVVLSRRGFTSGGAGPSIGDRPWLQKVAALGVAISMTIATADTFRVAEQQYAWGIQNAVAMQNDVLESTELKIISIISNTFLWLAQAQTLIRLFPRHREKVIIKWTAFALITLDVIFDCLDSFTYGEQNDNTSSRSRTFTQAVPALNYLFGLALGVLYAAWVIYYALMKRRYAFYHRQMKNMCFVAALSVLAILVPIVFFILDVSAPEFTSWGDYVRWVGAAAASVIVWEWVERIEALEREEKKDGILGREVFDGDEMTEITPSGFAWPRRRKNPKKDDGEDGSGASSVKQARTRRRSASSSAGRSNPLRPAVTLLVSRYRPRSRPVNATATSSSAVASENTNHDRVQPGSKPPLWPARPVPTATPVSRTDTPSAASTVYVVRHHALTETNSSSSPPPQLQQPPDISRRNSMASSHRTVTGRSPTGAVINLETQPPSAEAAASQPPPPPASAPHRWRSLARELYLPRFAGRGGSDEDDAPLKPLNKNHYQKQPSPVHDHNMGGSQWDIRSRFEKFAAAKAERLRERLRPVPDTTSLPVRIIPAPARAGAALALLREEEAAAAAAAAAAEEVRAGLGTDQVQSSHIDRSHSPAATSTPHPLAGGISAR